MSESKSIPAYTVAEWKAKGFTFEPTTDAIGCTNVTFGGKPFFFFRQLNVKSTLDLIHNLSKEVSPAEDNRLIVAGEFSDADTFLFFLVTAESYAEMKSAQERYYACLEYADDALRTFSETCIE
jgi:hypothetical protein